MSNDYARAYTEVLEIISYFPEEEYNKIPKEKINFYEKNRDKNYTFKIDTNIDLAEQNISENANAILVLIYKNYFATDSQKEELKELLQQNQEKIEEEKEEKYDPNNIFGNRKYSNTNTTNTNIQSRELALIKVENKSLYRKILDFFKRIIRK